MSSIVNTGKQNASFSWYSGAKDDRITTISVEKSAVSPSQTRIPIEIVQSVSIKNSPLPRLPSDSDSLYVHEAIKSISPLVDRIQARSPVEPSRINRTPIQDRSSIPTAHKHSYEASVSSPSVLPTKRVKTSGSPSSDLQVALDLSSNFRDFNTVADSDLVDFWFSHQLPLEIIALEEAERKERMVRRANPIIAGKMYAIQKEFMNRVNPKPSVLIEKTTSIVASISDLKTAIMEKGHEIMDSAVDTLNTTALGQTLNAIAQEAEEDDEIAAVWPRITPETKAAWDLARTERTTSPVNPILFAKWRVVNTEVKQKWGTSHYNPVYQAKLDNSIVGKATKAWDSAVHYTSDLLGSLRLSQQHDTTVFDLEWVRMQEEKERARRINESLVDPLTRTLKNRVELQLLRTIETL